MKFPFDPAEIVTPSYMYDLGLLQQTLRTIQECIAGRPFKVHYANKANNAVPPFGKAFAALLNVPGHIIPTERPQTAHATRLNCGTGSKDIPK